MRNKRTVCFLSIIFMAFAINAVASVSSFQSLEQNVPSIGKNDSDFSKHWKTEYDALSRPVKSIRPTGAEEQFSYDSRGNRTGFINAENKAMGFCFDAQGRVTSITNAINKVTSFDYDVNGNMTNRTDAMNRSTAYSFDGMNRIDRIEYPDTTEATFDYDLNGNLVEQTSLSAQTQFAYDEMNRLTSSLISVNSRSFAVTNSYDLNGNRTNITYPGGLDVSYSYDEENRLESVTTKYTNDTKTTSFNYDGASRLTNIVYPNGVSGDYIYDAESRILEYSYSSGSSNFLRHVLQRDPRGFKTIEDTYAGLLPNFTNEVHQTRTHNDADQLLTAGDTTHSYNANGCLTSSVSSAQSVDYSYDFDNRLTSADDTSYLYDASGVRVARIAGVSPAVVTNYFVIDYTDPLKRPLAETDCDGTITRYYIWAGFQLLAHIEADGTTRYYHSDEIGSTLALTDEAGVVTDQFAYSPYGQALGRTGSTETPYQWLGGYGVYYDADTDLHLTLHRAYSSKQKRFISSDPMGIDGGVNLYAYGNLNPLAFVDPYGLCAESGIGAWAQNTWDSAKNIVSTQLAYEKQYWGRVLEGSYAGVGTGFGIEAKITDAIKISGNYGELYTKEIGSDGISDGFRSFDDADVSFGPIKATYENSQIDWSLNWKNMSLGEDGNISSSGSFLIPLQNGMSVGAKLQINWNQIPNTYYYPERGQ